MTLSLRRLDWILLLAVLALVALSALLVWSATSHRVDLTDGDLKYHTDFRRVYATLLDDWLNVDSKTVLGEKFESLEQRIQAPGNGARVCSVLLEIDVDEQDYTP